MKSPDIWANLLERSGLVIGLLGCVFIINQIVAEWTGQGPSSLSTVFLAGFAFIYLFWTVYGLKFGRTAVWLGNAVAFLCQTILLILVIYKRLH